jgi:hypothetical protein
LRRNPLAEGGPGGTISVSTAPIGAAVEFRRTFKNRGAPALLVFPADHQAKAPAERFTVFYLQRSAVSDRLS